MDRKNFVSSVRIYVINRLKKEGINNLFDGGSITFSM